MEAYLDGNEPDEATLKKLIRKGTSDRRSIRCCAARRSRTRACSRCSTPSSTICRRRSTFRDQGRRRTTETERAVVASRRQAPLSLLAFKIMDDPFVGTLTFCRIYSGTLNKGTGVSTRRTRKSASAACC
jgi:elongation factor G